MKLEMYDSNLNKNDVVDRKPSIRCRAVIENKGRILAVHEQKWNLYTLPGGTLEEGETLTECVLREVLEETGVVASNPVETIRIVEHFENESYETVFFLAEFVRETNDSQLTSLEQEEKLTKIWLLASDLMGRLENSKSTHPYAANISHREFLGLIHSLK